MPPVNDRVLNWLYGVLTNEYTDVNRAYNDAAEALAQYPSLSPRTDVYTYENGVPALMLLLSGTLPVQFRGAIYRFPIALWVPHDYPHEPPMVYVTPTQDMLKSSMSDFLTVLRGVFAKEPPVVAKQDQFSTPQPTASPAPPPVPPTPEEWRRQMQPQPTESPAPTTVQAPALPPKPPKDTGVGHLPPLPPSMGQAAGYHDYGRPHPQYVPQRQPKPQVPDLLTSELDVQLPSQSSNSIPLPVPPVPPNPQKDALLSALSSALVAQTAQTVQGNAAALPSLRAQSAALRAAHARLQQEVDQLQRLDAALASNERVLGEAMREADRAMDDARTRTVPDVDDTLVAPTVVGGQLWGLVAEERGLEEAIFLLGRGLDRGRVGAEVFVKQTRGLAREQFLKKALIKKISKGMGLDENVEYGLRSGY
ncbi:Suppressor protein stp22 of temperature-sensitive alpha-factor receptor and arginine permease [Diplodia intermedia]|uniref:Suppressor protein stp22 of temperature-sensitive alpha-factor receptor and arginine permease n=1 Tax=Diplodia intermedia TaxID=856260 RepID=A0ABR3U1Y6_9PEZI